MLLKERVPLVPIAWFYLIVSVKVFQCGSGNVDLPVGTKEPDSASRRSTVSVWTSGLIYQVALGWDQLGHTGAASLADCFSISGTRMFAGPWAIA